MNIDELKTGAKPKQEPGKNIDGEELRDFGNGLKEFDPVANGFEKEEKELKPDDVTFALQEFDKQNAARIEEVEKYNELLDQYGGEISEEDLRKELGQEHITKILKDGSGEKFEDAPGEKADASKILKDNDEREETYHDDSLNSTTSENTYSELDELERELEDEEYMSAPEENKVIPIPNATATVEEKVVEKPAVEEVKPEPVVEEFPATEIKSTQELSEEDKDLAALDDDYEAPTEDFDEKLKVELNKKLKPVSKKFDLSTATVISKPITVTNTLNNQIDLGKKTFTWSLLRSQRPITIRSFTATELNNLSNLARNDSRSRETFKAIWDHIVGAGKGKDFDTWSKCTSYFDVDNIWFCIYGACFESANYLPFTCPNCNEVTVSTDIPVENMCKYDNPEVEAEMKKIRKLAATPHMGSVFAEYRVQVSDNIVVGFKEPSIYDAIIAPYLFDDEFRRKYNDIIGICSYIANIYVAEMTSQGLVLRPIAVKQFVGNELKTAKARIIQYAKIIRALSSDQYNIIVSHISALTNRPSVSYGLPAVTCDHCKKEIPEDRTAAADLVFMRHRLAILAG